MKLVGESKLSRFFVWRQNRQAWGYPSLKLTASLPLKMGWLEDDPFLLGFGRPIFRGKLAVSYSLCCFLGCTYFFANL